VLAGPPALFEHHRGGCTVTGGVYLIHFDRRYKHAGHYVGYANNIEGRVAHHRRGSGANLMRVVNEAGITWSVARVWEGASRTFERRCKNRAATMLCPVCSGDKAYGRMVA
jgi:predicted GIY-YIG superfamily endonuclease